MFKYLYLSPNIGNKRILPVSTSIYFCTGHPSLCNKARQRNQILRIGKKETKVTVFTDYIIAYTENTKQFVEKLSELKGKSSKIIE